MLRLIKTHNYLNGNIFSLVEFLITALIISPFAGYYIFHGPWLYAIIAVGITVNCLTIVFVATRSLLKKEKSIGIVKLYSDKDTRKRMRAEYPKMSQETLILCVAILIPFFLFLASISNIQQKR